MAREYQLIRAEEITRLRKERNALRRALRGLLKVVEPNFDLPQSRTNRAIEAAEKALSRARRRET